MSNKNNWLENLAVGDPVVVQTSGAVRPDVLDRVEKVTSRYFVVSGTNFYRTNGYETGDGRWGLDLLLEPTAERLEELKRTRLMARIESYARKDRLKALSTATLEQLAALLTGEGTADAQADAKEKGD